MKLSEMKRGLPVIYRDDVTGEWAEGYIMMWYYERDGETIVRDKKSGFDHLVTNPHDDIKPSDHDK